MLEVPSLLEPLGFDYVLYTHGDGLNSLAHGHYNFSRRKSGISFSFIFLTEQVRLNFLSMGSERKFRQYSKDLSSAGIVCKEQCELKPCWLYRQ